MAKESIVQIRMDSELIDNVEALYKQLGTSFADAVRDFAEQSLREKGFPFPEKKNTCFGALHKYADPELIPLEESCMERAFKAKYENSD